MILKHLEYSGWRYFSVVLTVGELEINKLAYLSKPVSAHPVVFEQEHKNFCPHFIRNDLKITMDDMKDKSIHFTAQKLSEDIQNMKIYQAFYKDIQVDVG